MVSRNPRSETSALASEPFGGDRAFERAVARCWCRYGRQPNSPDLPQQGAAATKYRNSIGKETPR